MDDQPSSPFHQSRTWDATAAGYEIWAEPFTRQYAEQALALAGGVAPGERVLDIAAGTGALTLAAARAGARVMGVDFSPGMVTRLRERLHADGWDRSGSEARVMDGQALDLPKGWFDAAFSMFGIMLFPDHRTGLAEMARVLRPGGRAVLGVWTGAEGAGPSLVLLQAYRALFPGWGGPDFPPGLLRLGDPDAVVEDMSAAGLRDVTVRTISGVWTAPSPDWVSDNADRLYRQSPLWAALDQNDRARLRGAIRERLAGGGAGEVRIRSDAHIGLGYR